MNPELFHIREDISAALAAGAPVIALESTIIAHGMPYPQNVQTARELEAIAEARGVKAATIAVLDGVVHVGLTDAQLLDLAKRAGVMKLSRRDLAWAVAQKRSGATTVAATMMVAERAGIRVFATGGIGGVHRGAEQTFDISADLIELARTDVTVVCAGPKAILDLPATLEFLETHGVPVVGYQTDELPAFYSRESGISLELRANRPDELARFCATRRAMGVEGGVLVVNPIPEAHAVPMDEMERTIQVALDEAERAGVSGKDITPFLLDRVRVLTGGQSLESNIALVKNNVSLAAELALAKA
jgi:pseudouridine-5'-phosphate glycosidase